MIIRLLVVALVTGAVLGGGAGAGAAKRHNPVVTPASGGPLTTFVVRYRVPRGLHLGDPTYERNGREEYVARVVGRSGVGCGGRAREFPARQVARKRGQVVTFRIRAPATGWCEGRTRVKLRRNYVWLDNVEDCSSTELPDAGSTQCEYYDVEMDGHDALGSFYLKVGAS